jgi:branched-subunit amino acid ABC-type transport system permease component
MTSHTHARDGTRRALFRWLVHLGLIVTVIVSLVFEPLVLAIHIAVGLAFAVLAGMHLAQRRRVAASLLARLARVKTLATPAGRLALADMLLAVITAGMLVSGFWDWFAGHPTKIRWHAITGVALAILLLVHTIRRWSRLRRSKVR